MELEAYVKNELNGLYKNDTKTVILSEQTAFSSRPVHKISARDGDVIRYVAITLEKNVSGKGMTAYWIGAAIKAEKYEKFLPLVDNIINTFEII